MFGCHIWYTNGPKDGGRLAIASSTNISRNILPISVDFYESEKMSARPSKHIIHNIFSLKKLFKSLAFNIYSISITEIKTINIVSR